VRPGITDGVLAYDGTPRLLLAGEYPYYRDEPRRWAPKLDAMRAVGLEVVSFYVPWRHHELNPGRITFTGPGNRDLCGFLDRIQAAGLRALPKPGPYVHAELPFGGLPDRLSPSLDPQRAAATSADGQTLRSQRLALPSPHDPAFLADTARWLGAVGDVLRERLHPSGPVVAVQIGNEGHFGETAMGVDALDYSRPGLDAYLRWRPGTRPPHGWQRPADGDFSSYSCWAQWLAESLASGLDGLADLLRVDVPVLMNASPPNGTASPALDAWLSRCLPSQPRRVAYGSTNWTGDVSRDDEAATAYVLALKRERGPVMEENWSLRWVSEECAEPAIPIYHALLGLACGATGLSVYTACATAGWGRHLSINRDFLAETTGDPAQLDPPYGDAAPIDLDGRPGPSAGALRTLLDFLRSVGPALVRAQPERGPVLLVQPAHAAVTAWAPGDDGLLPPGAGATLVPFVQHCLHASIPFAVASSITDPRMADRRRPVVTTSGVFMPSEVQRVLAAEIGAGRRVLLLGPLPSADEAGEPCSELADAVRAGGQGTVLDEPAGSTTAMRCWLDESGDPARRHIGVFELRLVGPGGEVFVFLFSRCDEQRRVVTPVGGDELSVTLPRRGCAVVRCVGSRIVSAYITGPDAPADPPARIEVSTSGRRVFGASGGDLVLRPSADGGPAVMGAREG
jgi:beta-galactosidase